MTSYSYFKWKAKARQHREQHPEISASLEGSGGCRAGTTARNCDWRLQRWDSHNGTTLGFSPPRKGLRETG